VTIIVLALIPLIQIQAITIPRIDPALLAPRTKTLKPVNVFSAQRHAEARAQKFTRTDSNILTEPKSIAERIAFVDEPTSPTIGLLPPATTTELNLALPGALSVGDEIRPPVSPPVPPPPPPPPPPLITNAKPIRRGGTVQAANLIYQVNPVYPPLARQI